MTYLGVDLGLGGAVGGLTDTGQLLGTWDVPVLTIEKRVTRRGKSRLGQVREYDVGAMKQLVYDTLLALNPAVIAIELAAIMPGESSLSARKIGYGEGLWRMLCYCAEIPTIIVPAATWKTALHIPKDKNAARLQAQRQWPTASLSRVKDDGRAEALWIAEYARRQARGGIAA